MKKILTTTIGALAVAALVQTSQAQVIYSDDFTYANAAAFEANWGRSDGVSFESNHILITRQDTPYFIPWNGNATLSLTPTDANPIRLTASLFDPNTGGNANNAVGFRENDAGGITPLFEMGLFTSGATSGYAIRLVNMGAGSPNWVFFDGGFREEGLHTFEATIGDSFLSVTLDLNSNGIVDHTLSYTDRDIATFGSLRIGGAGGTAVLGAPIGYGSLTLEVVPEPSTIALSILGGLGLLVGYMRRRK